MHRPQSEEQRNCETNMKTEEIYHETYSYIGDNSILRHKLIQEKRNIVLNAKEAMGKVLYDGMICEFEDLMASAAQDPEPKDEEFRWRQAYRVWKDEEGKVAESDMIDFWLLQGRGGYDYFHSLFYTQFCEDEYKYDVECYQQWDIIKGLMTLSSGVGFDSAKMMFKVNIYRYAKECSPTCSRHMPSGTRKDLLESLTKYFPSSENRSIQKI